MKIIAGEASNMFGAVYPLPREEDVTTRERISINAGNRCRRRKLYVIVHRALERIMLEAVITVDLEPGSLIRCRG